MRARYVVLLGFVAGCAGAPRRPHSAVEEPVAAGLVPALEVRLPRPAASYNERVDGAPTAFASAVFSGLAGFAQGRAVIEHDLRLDLAASALARVATIASPSHAVVEHALRSAGVVEVPARLVEVPAGAAADVVTRLIASAGPALLFANVRVGISTAHPGEPVVLLVVYSAGVTLAPVPRSVPLGEHVELVGALDDGFVAPRVRIRRGRGTTAFPIVTATGARAFRASMHCDAAGVRWITIEATKRDGPSTLVGFPVYCGEAPPASFWVEPTVNTANLRDGFDLESRLAAIAVRHRAARGLVPLRIDARATRAARDYAFVLQREDRLDHDIGGTPTSRVRAAGMQAPLVAQSVMNVPDLTTAAEILMNDTAYRSSLEAPELTHLGVGAARRGGAWYVVVTYVRIPPAIEVPVVRAALVAKLRSRERIAIDRDLEHAAQRLAEGLAIGWRRDGLWVQIKPDIPAATLHHGGAVAAVIESTYELDRFELADVNRDASPRSRMPRAIGVGVAQSARDGFLAGRIWVVVLSSGRSHRR